MKECGEENQTKTNEKMAYEVTELLNLERDEEWDLTDEVDILLNLKVASVFFHREGRYFEREFSVCGVSKYTKTLRYCPVCTAHLCWPGTGLCRVRREPSRALAAHSECKQKK